jgi:rhamnosyltransferase
MIRIAGVVVLYNPIEAVFKNVVSYIGQIETLFAVDNSEQPDPIIVEKIRCLGNIKYIWNGRNLGIATALNVGAALAVERGYDYLLTMDQDSLTSSNLICEYLDFLSDPSLKNVGIVSPYHIYENYDRPIEPVKVKETFTTITSGALLNLAAYKQVGPFMDELFIDYVDFEYCLRLHLHGFKIFQLNRALLHHQLGAIESKKILFRRVAVYHHPPIRVYYKFRNRLFVACKYFNSFTRWSINEFMTIGNDLIKILLFEDQKLEKCKMAFLGVAHYFLKRQGKLDAGK